MEFTYTILTPDKERATGSISAAGRDQAAAMLQQQGATVVSLLVKDSTDTGVRTSSLARRLQTTTERILNRIPNRNVVFFTRQLATMFAAGMTMERALDILYNQEKHEKLRAVLLSVNGQVKKGSLLSDALARHPAVFPGVYTALIRSGEMGGHLGTILDGLADYLEKQEEAKQKVVSALYYPVFVLGFLGCAVAILLLKIAPMFNDVYRSFGARLPTPTLMLMHTSEFMVRNLPVTMLLLLIAGGATFFFAQTDRGQLFFDTVRLRIPIVGTLIHDSIMARFSRTLSLLLGSSVPILDGLALVARTVGNRCIGNGIATARERVAKGSKLNEALEKTAIFPQMLTQLVATGEESGRIEELLTRTAEFYEKQVDALVSRFTSLIEPLLIVLMGLIVGTLVIIIYLPIFYLGIAIKRGMN